MARKAMLSQLLLSHLLTNTALSSLHDLLKLDLGIISGIEIEVFWFCLDPACDCNVGISVQNAEECFQLAFLLQHLPHPGPSGHATCQGFKAFNQHLASERRRPHESGSGTHKPKTVVGTLFTQAWFSSLAILTF